MRLAIVINPISGRGGRYPDAAARRIAHARRLIDRLHVEGEVVATAGRGHAVELARQFAERGFDIVMAWGGDGTANEVAGPLIGTRTALGIIPSGSGDGFARSLGVGRDPEAAFARAMTGQTNEIDVGYLGDRHFLNVAGIGFDAAVAEAFNDSRRRGALGYVVRIPPMLWRYRPASYEVRWDGETRRGEHLLIAFANGREYGNRMVLADAADPRDGWLDAVLVAKGPPWRQLWRARRLAFAPGRPAEGIVRSRLKTAVVAAARLKCHVDGETFQARDSIEVRIASRALRVCGVSTS